MNKAGTFVYRYTCLASALDILINKKLTLLSPNTWSDKNDVAFMRAYKAAVKAKTVLAMCFTGADDLSLHWNEFAPGTDGVRIEIEKAELEHAAANFRRVIFAPVAYRAVEDIHALTVDPHCLPFTKRLPYRGEEEMRLVYRHEAETSATYGLPIRLSSIRRITLGPRLPSALIKPVRETIQKIEGCKHIGVYQTTLLFNKRWVKAVAHHQSQPEADDRA